jgi:hypothetical protein
VIKVRTVVAAEIVIRDGDSNRMSAINLYEQLRPAGFPLLIPRFAILAYLERDAADDAKQECTVRVTVGDQQLVNEKGQIDFGEGRQTRLVIQFQGFLLKAAGDVRVTVATKDSEMSSQLLEVHPPPVPPPTITQT